MKTFKVKDELHKQVKRIAVCSDVKLEDLVEQIMLDWLEKQEKVIDPDQLNLLEKK